MARDWTTPFLAVLIIVIFAFGIDSVSITGKTTITPVPILSIQNSFGIQAGDLLTVRIDPLKTSYYTTVDFYRVEKIKHYKTNEIITRKTLLGFTDVVLNSGQTCENFCNSPGKVTIKTSCDWYKDNAEYYAELVYKTDTGITKTTTESFNLLSC